MKILKIIFITISLVITSIILISCTKEQKINDILISKYFENGDVKRNMIEIYNSSENEIDLTNYKVAIYRNGNLLEKVIINLDNKKLASKSFLLIANSNVLIEEFPQTFENKDKIINENLAYNGNDPITIEKKEKIIDIIGILNGSDYKYGENVSLIRNKDIFYSSKKYDIRKFIGFVPEYFQSLSQIDETADLAIVEKGPRFNKEYLNLPYYKFDNNGTKIGLGGAVKATVVNYVDGDTTRFLIDPEYGNRNALNKDMANSEFTGRYYFVNTPESTPKGGFEAFGKWGTLTTNELLKRAQKNGTLYVQSVDNDNLLENFNRSLTLVWADGYLVNWILVRDSLSKYRASEKNELNNRARGELLQYKNILLSYYLAYAQFLAEKDKIRVNNGLDIDPMFDYKKKNFIPNYEKHFKPTYQKYLYFEDSKQEEQEELNFILFKNKIVDKEQLKEKVTSVENTIIAQENYNTYYLERLRNRLDNIVDISKYIIKNKYIDQKFTNTILKELDDEKNFFIDSHIKNYDKTELNNKIQEAENLKNSENFSTKYTKETKDELEKRLTEAKVISQKDAYKIEITDALFFIDSAIKNMKLVEKEKEK